MATKYVYTGCQCGTVRAEHASDPRLTVHCLRLNDYRSFADASMAGANLDAAMTESYLAAHGGQPQYQFDGVRGASNPPGTPQVQRRMSAKARADNAAQWTQNYVSALTSGSDIKTACDAADVKCPAEVLAGAPRGTKKPAEIKKDPLTGEVTETETRHPLHRFIFAAEKATEWSGKLKSGLCDLHKLNSTDPVLFAALAERVLDADDLVSDASTLLAFLNALPNPELIKTEYPKIEPAAGCFISIKEKYHGEMADSLGVEQSDMPDLQLLILSVVGALVIAVDPADPLNKVSVPTAAMTVMTAATPESIAQATELAAVRRVKRVRPV